jgi:hypothetical protein
MSQPAAENGAENVPKRRGKKREWTLVAMLPRVTAVEFLSKANLNRLNLSTGNIDKTGKSGETYNLHCIERCDAMQRIKVLHRTEEEKDDDLVATHEKSGVHNHVIGETTKPCRGLDEGTKNIIRQIKNVHTNGGGKAVMMSMDRMNTNAHLQSHPLPTSIKQVRISDVFLFCSLF